MDKILKIEAFNLCPDFYIVNGDYTVKYVFVLKTSNKIEKRVRRCLV